MMCYPLTFEIENLHFFLGFGIKMMVTFILKRINCFGIEFNPDHSGPHNNWKTVKPTMPEFYQK